MTRDTIAVWQWDLDQADPDADKALSTEERERAGRFIVPHAARRYTAGRAAMRRVLAALRGVSASELVFTTGRNGKPALLGGPEFNLSHSGAAALFAVADFPVGIDIEAVRPLKYGVTTLVFTVAEQVILAEMSGTQRDTMIIRGWTRKEAVIKAQGGSIADLQGITVLPDPILPGWQVTELSVDAGYAASVAAGCQGWRVIRQED